MIKLKQEVDNGISLYDMKDGDVAVITVWPHSYCVGKIVQRYGNELVLIGQHSGACYPIIFNGATDNHHRVKLLPAGTELVIE
jgi:hypothetical protein